MWAEIAGAGGFVAMMGIIARMQNTRIGKKVSKELCDERTQGFKQSLDSGIERFKKNDELLAAFNTEQIKQGKVLVEVHTIVKRMEMNGKK